MTRNQKIILETKINGIQCEIDKALKYMQAANFAANHEQAERWSNRADDEITRLDGIKIALSVLGYSIGWENNKRVIIPAER